MTKSPPKVDSTPKSPTQEEILQAYQVHTLAQILYGQLTTAGPWTAPVPAQHPYGPHASFGVSPWGAVPPVPYPVYPRIFPH